jgi:uncharacterized protein (TIGR02001 family)
VFKKISTSVVAFAILTSSNLIANDANGVEITSNVGVTSNLVWRGKSASGDEVSIFGGFDLEHNSGFYAGTWLASNTTGTEVDLYAGFSNSLEIIDYDIGFISYQYPNLEDSDSEEVYFSLSKDIDKLVLSATYSVGLDDAEDNIEGTIGYDFDVVTASLTAGDYDNTGTYYRAGLSKDITKKLNLSVEYSDYSDDNNSSVDEDHFIVTLSSKF